jgi:hypothetical protein
MFCLTHTKTFSVGIAGNLCLLRMQLCTFNCSIIPHIRPVLKKQMKLAYANFTNGVIKTIAHHTSYTRKQDGITNTANCTR